MNPFLRPSTYAGVLLALTAGGAGGRYIFLSTDGVGESEPERPEWIGR